MADKNGNGNSNKRVTRDELKTADTQDLCDELITRMEFRPEDPKPEVFKRQVMKRSGYQHSDAWSRPPEKKDEKKRRTERRVIRDDYDHVIGEEDDEDDEEDEW